MIKNNKFQEFTNSDRIWSIGSIHSSLESFQSIKKYIFSNFKNGDKLIFLGNLIGYNNQSKEIITDVLNLRFSLMAKFSLDHEDVVFLRGAQEEMFSKLLQLQIAPNPREIIDWIFSHGVDQTLVSYNFEADQFRNIATQGTIQIDKLTSKLIKKISETPGHKEFFHIEEWRIKRKQKSLQIILNSYLRLAVSYAKKYKN